MKESLGTLLTSVAGLQVSPARLLRWGRLLVVFFPLLLYAGSLRNDFLMDDELIVTANTHLTAGRGPSEIFHRPEQFWDFALPYYRPLTNLSYWADARLWGMNPSGFHLTNWLLHAATTLVVFELVRLLAGGVSMALPAALLFAAHPIHTESVMMVQGRTDLLATVLILLSLLAMLHCLLAADRKRALAAGGISIVAFSSALLAKEIAVTGLALGALLCWAFPTPSPQRKARQVVLASAGLAVLVGYFWIRHVVIGQVLPMDLSQLDTPRSGLVPITFALYARFLTWPFFFSFIRSIPTPEAWTDPRVVLSGLLSIAILAGLAFLARRDRLMAVGGGWTLVTLLPVLNLFPIPGFVVAERYLYLPSVGFCLLLAAGIRWASRAWPAPAASHALLAMVAALLVAFATTIQMRAIQWRDPVGVFEAMAKRAPSSFFVQNNLGLEYLKAGETQEATEALLRARDLEPANPVVWNNLGVALQQSGRLGEARVAYERAIALNREYAQAYRNLAEVLSRLGDQPGAGAAFRRAHALGPAP